MARRRANTLKFLFIGNSFTARNDLPGLIARLAELQGQNIQHRLISAGGASLRAHWNAGTAAEAIRNGKYDYVVLQEQSTLPIKNAQRFHENVRLFQDTIKEAGSTMVLYLTWARENAPQTQQKLTVAYTSIGRKLGAVVVPVGVAWEKYLAKYEQPVLHDKDKSHPTLAGTYLAACTFVGALFRENLDNYDYEVAGLEKKDMIKMQKLAWQVCRSLSKSDKRKRT